MGSPGLNVIKLKNLGFFNFCDEFRQMKEIVKWLAKWDQKKFRLKLGGGV